MDPAAWAAVESAAPDALFLDGVDVRDEERVASAVRAAVERFRRIDVLVNAAGVEGIGPAHELTQESWDRTVDINLKGSFLVSKHVLPSMLAQKSGSVIHVASVEGLEGHRRIDRLQRLEGRRGADDEEHGARLRAFWASA